MLSRRSPPSIISRAEPFRSYPGFTVTGNFVVSLVEASSFPALLEPVATNIENSENFRAATGRSLQSWGATPMLAAHAKLRTTH
jgi:hypothetical protein